MIRYTKEFIQQLLDKYMNGTTTLEEEDILAQYFRTQEVPQEWDNYRQLFQEIEAMKPQPAPRHWARWSIAVAAILIGVCFLFPIGQEEHSASTPMVAQTDTVRTQPLRVATPDTIPSQQERYQPAQTKKSYRKRVFPSIHSDDKASILMAQAEQEQRDAERQLEQCQLEMIDAQLASYGFIPVKQEDGTIIYMNEQTNDIAYEE